METIKVNDTMTGLLQAVQIEKGIIPVVPVKDLPAKTYRVPVLLTDLMLQTGETINACREKEGMK